MSDNSSQCGSGLYYDSNVQINFINSRIGNDNIDGAIGYLSLQNTIVDGAIYCSSGTIALDRSLISPVGQYCLNATNTQILFNQATIANNLTLTNCDVQMTNSILWHTDEPQIIITEGTVLEVDYSLLQNGLGSISNYESSVDSGPGLIQGDPLFVDPDNTNFQLTADSPCIDAGNPDVPHDSDCTVTDLGAYSFSQCPDPGDISGDGILNVIDIVMIVNHCIMDFTDECVCADVNGDCVPDILDIVTIINLILGNTL